VAVIPEALQLESIEAFVKIYRNGILYLCLLAVAATGRAQQADPQSAAPPAAADSEGAAQNPATQDPTKQNPTTQNPPATQNPTTQNPPAQNPPARPPAQTPATQTPPPTTPPVQTAPQQPATGPIVNAPPELPKYPDVRLPGEYGFYFGITAWTPKQQPTFDKGRNTGIVNNSFVTMQGTPTVAPGFETGLAIGLHNTLSLSFWESRAAGDFVTPVNLTVFNGQTYTSNTLISTDYLIQNLKISFAYLTWPYPVESRRFRFKTLWQIQYVSARSGFDAPQLPLTDANGNPIIDANGNPISYAATGTKWFILPTFGASATEYITRNIRFEASGDGFAIPHHSTLYEAEGSLAVRISSFELRGGAKMFHFKTSTSQDFYMRGTLASAFVGIRWYSH